MESSVTRTYLVAFLIGLAVSSLSSLSVLESVLAAFGAAAFYATVVSEIALDKAQAERLEF